MEIMTHYTFIVYCVERTMKRTLRKRFFRSHSGINENTVDFFTSFFRRFHPGVYVLLEKF